MAIGIAWRIWYESQHILFDELRVDRVLHFLMAWFVAGVVVVALDRFRRKAEWEQRFWKICAIAFGASTVCAGLFGGLLLSGLRLVWSEAVFYLLIVVVSTLSSPILMLLLAISAVGLPAYTLYLTYRALRSWWTYLWAA